MAREKTIAELSVLVGANTTALKRSLSNMEKRMQKFDRQMGNIAKSLAGAFAVGVIINFNKEAALMAGQMEGIKAAFMGLNQPGLLKNLQKATRNTVTNLKLMQSAVRAQNFKIPLEKLGSFFEFATKRATQTGESVDFLVESIINGIGRKSTLVMDNLGISAAELQEEIRKVGDFGIASGNIIERELGKMGDVAVTAKDKYAQFNVELENFQTQWGEIVNIFGLFFLPLLSKSLQQVSNLTAGLKDLFSGKITGNQQGILSDKFLRSLGFQVERRNKNFNTLQAAPSGFGAAAGAQAAGGGGPQRQIQRIDEISKKAATSIGFFTEKLNRDLGTIPEKIEVLTVDEFNKIQTGIEAMDLAFVTLGDSITTMVDAAIFDFQNLGKTVANIGRSIFGTALSFLLTGGPAGGLLGKLFGGLQTGTGFVHDTGLQLLHKGEKVMPAHAASGGTMHNTFGPLVIKGDSLWTVAAENNRKRNLMT